MIVLVPLPLFISIPGTAEPGMVIVWGEPGFPVTRPVPREVVTPGVVVIPGVGVTGGATTGGGAIAPPAGGACAWAKPVNATSKAVVGHALIISPLLEGVRRAAGYGDHFGVRKVV
jgi:hypothetical protein